MAATLNPLLTPISISFSSPIRPIPRPIRAACVSSSPRSPPRTHRPRLRSRRPRPHKFVCRRAKNSAHDDFKFPDPIREFAEEETSKFKEHMAWRLEQKKEYFGEHVEEIVGICTEILGTFLEQEYCGPGTLLVHPFLDMKGAIKEKGLPGAPQAARAAVAWAEKNIDKDWKNWTGED